MHHQTLNGKWKMREEKVGHWFDAEIPGSVMSSLLSNNAIEDPFWRLNEYEARELFRKDYEFQREFTISPELYDSNMIELVCHGLDTLAEVYINDVLLMKVNNMHRTWKTECKSLLKQGDNQIRIVFRAPITYIESYEPQEGKEINFVPTGVMKGNQYIRKAHCMFGWDWGMQVPDTGIWRDIELIGYSDGKIEDVDIIQRHENASVDLIINTTLAIFDNQDLAVEYILTNPEGKISKYIKDVYQGRVTFTIRIDQPQLWWPNGYGDQPLYHLDVVLVKKKKVCDSKDFTLGIRTLTISQEKDEWGSEFAFEVNGIKIFAKGANYIPEDTIYSRITKERIEHLISSSIRANYNCLRIWGGGYYPSDYFYELCDRNGIIVWQDLMYACNLYEFTKEFEQNIVEETKDNVRRLRHHACLGLWCGNNEMETAWVDWEGFRNHSDYLKADYIKQFEYVLPKTVEAEDNETFYWPSSPSSGGSFVDPNGENHGDVHYWAVWHGLKPFEDYRNYYFRFCSEFGFQSFPSIKTVNTFTEEMDRNIFSKVMESHQKNNSANGIILYYLSENFLYPKDFESLIYVSQVLQGIAIKFGVEHWRRHRGRCMGSLYWQINDSWPVASWSSIDYYGRWKALHYMAKNFYAPVAGSLTRTDTTVDVYLQNETREEQQYHVDVYLKSLDFTVLYQEEHEITVPALSASFIASKDYKALIKGKEDKVFVEAVFTDSLGIKSTEIVTFVPFKHFILDHPMISVQVEEKTDRYIISLHAESLACFVELDFMENDVIFSDNYFYITGKEPKEIELLKSDIQGNGINNAMELKNKLQIRSLRDTY